MQRSICVASSIIFTVAVLAGETATANPSRSYSTPSPAYAGARTYGGVKNAPLNRVTGKPLQDQAFPHKDFRRKDLLLAGGYPFFSPYLEEPRLIVQPVVFPAPYEERLLLPPVFLEAPRPYAPPSFTILGRGPRTGTSGPVKLTRGTTVEAAVADPKVIFLNDDGSERQVPGKPIRRK
jgi:hypothetical protein